MRASNVTAGRPHLHGRHSPRQADTGTQFASRILHGESCSLLPNYTIILHARERREAEREEKRGWRVGEGGAHRRVQPGETAKQRQ